MTNLKNLRDQKGVSQQIVADYLGITRQAYSNYEAGKRQADYETLLKLGEFFNVSINELLQEAPSLQQSRETSDEDIKFALFGGDGEITDEMYDEVKAFAQFVKQKHSKKEK